MRERWSSARDQGDGGKVYEVIDNKTDHVSLHSEIARSAVVRSFISGSEHPRCDVAMMHDDRTLCELQRTVNQLTRNMRVYKFANGTSRVYLDEDRNSLRVKTSVQHLYNVLRQLCTVSGITWTCIRFSTGWILLMRCSLLPTHTLLSHLRVDSITVHLSESFSHHSLSQILYPLYRFCHSRRPPPSRIRSLYPPGRFRQRPAAVLHRDHVHPPPPVA